MFGFWLRLEVPFLSIFLSALVSYVFVTTLCYIYSIAARGQKLVLSPHTEVANSGT